MSEYLWDEWTPGVLSESQMIELVESGYIKNVKNKKKSVDYSSIDLHLSKEGYLMRNGSVKPSGSKYQLELNKIKGLAKKIKPEKEGIFTLEPKNTYLFRLRESLSPVGELSKAGFHGMATAKSSVGRVDVLVRLIVDGMDRYEYFNPDGLSKGTGDLFLEITPMTFPVRVKRGISLSQLRLFYGKPELCKMEGDLLYKTILNVSNNSHGSLTVDLTKENISGIEVSAFSTKRNILNDTPIDLWERKGKGQNLPNPWDYWRVIRKDKSDRLIIEKDLFYILKSKEKIRMPSGIAIYCRAIDERIGEMRIHYAGFVHPFFGKNNEKSEGTPLIFEVRGHNIEVSLKDGEKMANLVSYRLSKDNKKHGNKKKSSYELQSLKLSKFFNDWPDKMVEKDDGKVEPEREKL